MAEGTRPEADDGKSPPSAPGVDPEGGRTRTLGRMPATPQSASSARPAPSPRAKTQARAPEPLGTAVRRTAARVDPNSVTTADPGSAGSERVETSTDTRVGPGASRIIADADLRLDRQELSATVGRLRRLLPTAMALWLGFFFVDWVLATWVVPGPLMPYLLLRLLGLLPLLGAWLRLRSDPMPSPRVIAALDILMTGSSAGILAAMCMLSGGLTSPYASYIAMVIAGRAAVWPNHWRTGVVRLGIAAIASPVVMLVALPLSPLLQVQVFDASARATWFFHMMLVLGAWMLLVIASHNAWALRRQVFRSRSIGRYRLDRRIGKGGMGEVWVAWHDQLSRDVALKILRPQEGTQEAEVTRFEREIKATAALTHPNTVRIFDHGVTEDGLWYYAMELLTGEDLQRLVERQGPVSPERVVRLGRQAAGALAEAHESGIVHRDVKPENLFIAEQGGERDFVKVLDFGIAQQLSSDEPRLTGTGWVAGTPAYLSPEAAAGMDVGPPADVYALGAVLYYAITGTAPFQAAQAQRLLQLHMSVAPEPPSDRLGRELPALLEHVILRCLEKSPAERFESAAALAHALDECAVKLGFGTLVPRRPAVRSGDEAQA